MSVLKRGLAFLFALCLVVNLALYPLRARAMAGALTVASAGVVVTAALMASGIYPYEQQKQFAEYVTGNLAELWDDYLEWREGNTISPEDLPPSSLQELTGFVAAGSIVVTRKVWNALSDFVTWIKDEFSVADNQTGVQLGTLISDLLLAPVVQPLKVSSVAAYGLYVGTRDNGKATYLGVDASGVYVGNVLHGISGIAGAYGIIMLYKAGDSASTQWLVGTPKWNPESLLPGEYYSLTFNSTRYKYATPSTKVAQIPDTIPVFDSIYDFCAALGAGGNTTLSGITADTTTVVPLESLPADTEWGGFQVAGTFNPDGTIETIEQGVTAREKPVVRPVEVEIQQGTEVDAETGEVVENPVVITQDDVIPAVSELIMPGSVIDTIVSGMQTKFPFCLPFDIMRIAQAFVVPPSAPVISLTFHDPFSDSDYTISVDLSPWDEVAAVVRMLWTMLLLVGFSLNIPRIFLFNNVAATDLV